VYRILGELFLEPPTESTVADVSAWADRWLETNPDSLTVDIGEPLGTLIETNSGEVETIRAEFTRLFRGATNQPSPDPPYESLYRENTIYGASTTEVRESYLEAGMDLVDDGGEPPDHLGIELQFLGELRSKEAEGEKESGEELRTFIEEHVGQWYVDFADAVDAKDPHPFYGAVVRLTGAILEAEAERLDANCEALSESAPRR
jgi:TorA maturation chaperone TorD